MGALSSFYTAANILLDLVRPTHNHFAKLASWLWAKSVTLYATIHMYAVLYIAVEPLYFGLSLGVA